MYERERISVGNAGGIVGGSVVGTTTRTKTFVGEDGRTYRVREPGRVIYKS